ncbi:DUF1905 domain-containing protein [Actinotalea sp. BY-33]|uniref:DUF1905 domain-containing protein n=1 Tax=Actinotalea soli TaxID=2819234 RepID=A0A939RW46_9CELL|nr:DUF1905 domain-containing protein [Actinotalea soli]MBO1751811.1 DUF1905 domain-containing protein [Actinotalea soli]
MEHSFEAPLWLWQAGRGEGWAFVSLPPEVADEVLDVAAPVARGFGSVRVQVRLGATVWRTSLFPSSTEATYVLPVKKAVRSAEGLAVGDSVQVSITLVDL